MYDWKVLKRKLRDYFEPLRKNKISLGEDESLEDKLKHLKVAESNTPLRLSDDTVDVQGSFNVRGTIDADAITVNGTSVSTEPDGGAITALNNATANELVTVGATTTELDAESTLTYTANNLVVSGADSRIGVDGADDADGDDLDIHAGNADGTNNAGGDLYLNAGRSTGSDVGGNIIFTTSEAGSSGSTLRGEVQVGKINSDGQFRLNDGDATAGEFICYNFGTTTDYASLRHTGLYSAQALTIDGGAGSVAIDDDGHTYATFTKADSSFKLHETGVDASVDYFKITCAANGATTISTVDAYTALGNLIIDPDGYLELNSGGVAHSIRCEDPLKIKESADAVGDLAGYGQLWVHDDTPNVLMFTDDGGQDIHLTKNTAVWGGNLARATGHNGKWLGIPSGHQGGALSFGTTIGAPDTALNVTTQADDLGSVIWQSIHKIRVTNCRIWYGQGGATNTRHSVCLMRYAIDADGTLSNGVEVAGVDSDAGSDDYTTLAFTDLTMTSDVVVTNAQVLIAMVYLKDAANAAMSAKCILEYQDLP